MTITSGALRKLAALSLSSEQMAGVLDILASFVEEEERAEAKKEALRERDRERKRNSKGNPQESGRNSETVSADTKNPPPPLSPPSLSPIPPNSPPPISPPVNSALAQSPADGVRKTLETVLSPTTAQDVIEHRKKIRKPLTVRAAQGLVKAYGKCRDGPEAAAEAQITNGWLGFNPEWMENNGYGSSGNRRAKTSGVVDTVRRLQAEAQNFGGAGGEPDLDREQIARGCGNGFS